MRELAAQINAHAHARAYAWERMRAHRRVWFAHVRYEEERDSERGQRRNKGHPSWKR